MTEGEWDDPFLRNNLPPAIGALGSVGRPENAKNGERGFMMRYETYAADAWDISPLAGIGLTGYWPYPQLQKGTSGGCENTVALAGKCYHAGAVKRD